ncbi:MAG TPA: hypothetical protein VE993_04065, partial [Stellaceae bacterium]|nr:hypothetical protein [Stellaceae bacterium]
MHDFDRLRRRLGRNRARRRFGARQVQYDRRASAHGAFDTHIAAALGREAVHLAQAQTGALADRLGRKERLE